MYSSENGTQTRRRHYATWDGNGVICIAPPRWPREVHRRGRLPSDLISVLRPDTAQTRPHPHRHYARRPSTTLDSDVAHSCHCNARPARLAMIHDAVQQSSPVQSSQGHTVSIYLAHLSLLSHPCHLNHAMPNYLQPGLNRRQISANISSPMGLSAAPILPLHSGLDVPPIPHIGCCGDTRTLPFRPSHVCCLFFFHVTLTVRGSTQPF